ncbi:MAG: hypothetical protein U5K31_07230 [Balneolaceae bacterium]|nr:hypothetical protein [Balneolaceae bacterium]
MSASIMIGRLLYKWKLLNFRVDVISRGIFFAYINGCDPKYVDRPMLGFNRVTFCSTMTFRTGMASAVLIANFLPGSTGFPFADSLAAHPTAR